ncbi:TIGR03087 family PEP-CTERM/XrtA system glycosyltransferase [Acidihalobacter ferrooxydans]|uniref:Sugar transferase n=1 Tax=Acidihalobacter ferrooxydans TaxID=1765967 RepID=A0A1P8UI25_9GAMM|nr:TIGR03087 family PEP-CTERM/XrtA system glycosyltransferase [Acidihalobacter ferrooxydans]APZ43490.1 hypothetical protein BW247_10645 [Acidihalobacter ferrooxydans]
MKPDLLFLAHRIPYPPDKGDKIRSFHLLAGLARHYRVHLGAFVDDPDDVAHAESLREFCASVYLPRLRPLVGDLRGLPDTVRGAPLSLARYNHARFARWVGHSLRQHGISRVFAFSAAVGRYGLARTPRHISRIMDFVDVDSEKWSQYAERERGPLRLIYAREAHTLRLAEARLAAAYDASLFVSAEEAALFASRHPALRGRVQAIPNGVDGRYFDPASGYPCPYAPGVRAVVFTGAMDYQANVDGVVWFCREVWPTIRATHPEARFFIVGRRPAPAVRTLANEAGVEVTGRVPDVRPYLAHAAVACAPLRVARGVQNKVLEALAMGQSVVGTSAAWEGLGPFDMLFGDQVDDPAGFARAISARLERDDALGHARREAILGRFSWTQTVDRCRALLESGLDDKPMEREAS